MRSVIAVGVVAALVVIGFVVRNRRRRLPKPVELLKPAVEVDRLGPKEVIGFFKRPEFLEQLRKFPNKIAVATKNRMPDGRTCIILTLFDTIVNKVEEPLMVYHVKNVEGELLQLFGDKDMLVIK